MTVRQFFLDWVLWSFFFVAACMMVPRWYGKAPNEATRYAWFTGLLAAVGMVICGVAARIAQDAVAG